MSKISEASRDHIADENFAFPKERKEPIHHAAHMRNAIALSFAIRAEALLASLP
jgi:hypothetical protein